MNRVLGILIIFLAISASSIFQQPVYSQTQKQSYGQLQGEVLNEWRKPIGGVTIALTPVANGYSTAGGSAITDVNGHYIMSNIPKFIYSSGPDPKVVDYYVTVNYPGYDLYTSDSFNFKDDSSLIIDIRLDRNKSSN